MIISSFLMLDCCSARDDVQKKTSMPGMMLKCVSGVKVHSGPIARDEG